MHAEGEDAAEACALRINSDSASIPFHNLLDDEEAEAGTFLLLGGVLFVRKIRWAAAIIRLDCVL